MKVIFLDIDGVLNTKDYRENPDVDYFEHPISEIHMCLLEYLVKTTGAKIVLSSTWREYWKKGKTQSDPFGVYINKLFSKYGLEIYDKTPELRDRSDEIDAWKKLHQGEVEEMGTHRELIQKDGIYRRIYEIQMRHDDRKEVER